MPEHQPAEPEKSQGKYTIKDAMQVTDDILNLSKEKKYPVGAFVHGLIFTLEFSTVAYGIPAQQIAEIKRDCRKYINELVRLQGEQPPEQKKSK